MRQRLGQAWTGGPPNSPLLWLHSMAESTDIEMVCLRSNQLADRWKSYFDQYDEQRVGEIKMADFVRILEEPEFQAEVDPHKVEVFRLKTAHDMTRTISYQEFINIMSGKRNPSFRQALEQRETEGWRDDFVATTVTGRHTRFQKMVRWVAKEYLTDDAERQYYADRYTCWPPPVFIPVISLLEVGCFIYYCVDSGDLTANGPVPIESLFIYRPDRRIEVWRFLFYIFIHAGWVHLFFNLLVQILVGLPLEMIHGSVRVGAIYLAGVLAGSLGTSVFDMEALLVGASGGVYALLAAHLANILLNFADMQLGILKLAAVFVVASADVGFAIWDRYSSADNTPPIGYTAHLMGALAGLTIGLVVLKNFEQRLHEQFMWWIALALYMGCTGFAIFWNIFYY